MDETCMQHGLDWEPEVDPTGWLASEKFNGCRAYWDGTTLWSRGGIAIAIPQAWRDALPRGIALDGEIYDDLDGLTRCTAAVRWGRFTPTMTYRVFDVPDAPGPWSYRLQTAWAHENAIIHTVTWWEIRDTEHLRASLESIHNLGGEGLMLRHPDIPPTPGRTDQLLKVKYAHQFNTLGLA